MIGDGPGTSEKRRKVLVQYGQWLSDKHLLEDAAVAFLAAGDLESAFKEYREANQWRMAMSLAGIFAFTCQDHIGGLCHHDVGRYHYARASGC